MNTITTTASEARKNLYTLIKEASKGFKSYEITLRGSENSVVLISKSELESWQETLDILNNPSEIEAIRKGKKEKKLISHNNLLKEISLSK